MDEMLEAANSRLPPVGLLVVALVDTSVCKRSEIGVVYESDHSTVSVIFKDGGYDGFNKDDLMRMILALPAQSDELETYHFTNVMKLMKDYKEGEFDEAFDVGIKFLELAGEVL